MATRNKSVIVCDALSARNGCMGADVVMGGGTSRIAVYRELALNVGY